MDRTLIIADNLTPACPESEALQAAGAIRRSGAAVHLIDLGRGAANHDSPDLTALPWPNRYCSETLSRLAAIGNRFRPDQIQCWGPNAITAGIAANRKRSARLVAIHNSARSTIAVRSNWKRRFEMSQMDLHFARTESAVEELATHWPKWNLSLLPWSRPPGSASDSASDSAAVLKQLLDLPANAKLAGTVAPLVQETRIKDFIWAADLMTCIRDDVYWLVIGDGPHLWRLKRFARHLEAGNHLRFIGWHEKAASIIESLDVYVEPSTYFESSTGVVQAISGGIPVVATTSPVHRQLVKHGKSGFVVERGARNEIARCVNRLINQPAIAKKFSHQARQLADDTLIDSADLVRIAGGYALESV